MGRDRQDHHELRESLGLRVRPMSAIAVGEAQGAISGQSNGQSNSAWRSLRCSEVADPARL